MSKILTMSWVSGIWQKQKSLKSLDVSNWATLSQSMIYLLWLNVVGSSAIAVNNLTWCNLKVWISMIYNECSMNRESDSNSEVKCRNTCKQERRTSNDFVEPHSILWFWTLWTLVAILVNFPLRWTESCWCNSGLNQ